LYTDDQTDFQTDYRSSFVTDNKSLYESNVDLGTEFTVEDEDRNYLANARGRDRDDDASKPLVPARKGRKIDLKGKQNATSSRSMARDNQTEKITEASMESEAAMTMRSVAITDVATDDLSTSIGARKLQRMLIPTKARNITAGMLPPAPTKGVSDLLRRRAEEINRKREMGFYDEEYNEKPILDLKGDQMSENGLLELLEKQNNLLMGQQQQKAKPNDVSREIADNEVGRGDDMRDLKTRATLSRAQSWMSSVRNYSCPVSESQYNDMVRNVDRTRGVPVGALSGDSSSSLTKILLNTTAAYEMKMNEPIHMFIYPILEVYVKQVNHSALANPVFIPLVEA
jgi:hypothetical protein